MAAHWMKRQMKRQQTRQEHKQNSIRQYQPQQPQVLCQSVLLFVLANQGYPQDSGDLNFPSPRWVAFTAAKESTSTLGGSIQSYFVSVVALLISVDLNTCALNSSCTERMNATTYLGSAPHKNSLLLQYNPSVFHRSSNAYFRVC